MSTLKVITYNHTLFAYTTMLRQLGARFSDPAIISSNAQIEDLRQNLGRLDEINRDNLGVVKDALKILRLCVINLEITVINRDYAELEPICQALDAFFHQVLDDIRNSGMESE